MSCVSENVVPGGFCVGCGACVVPNSNTGINEISLNSIGQFEPVLSGIEQEASLAADKVCPFSDDALDEDELRTLLFSGNKNYDERIGSFDSVFVGNAGDSNGFRMQGSSGGLTNWLLSVLLEKGLVDAVIVVSGAISGSSLYSYRVVEDPTELAGSAKSKYYPVEMSKVIALIRSSRKRYAFVGVPCFIKAVRNMCVVEPVLNERILYCIALVCGHLKSTGYTEYLAAQMSVLPHNIRGIDFRVKISGQPANRYATKVIATDKVEQRNVFDLDGTDWGLGFFKYKSCDFCDDVAGEVADVTFGDAWLSSEVRDWRGNNIVISRNSDLTKIFRDGVDTADLELRESSAEEFYLSQSANYRHKVDGLVYRLQVAREKGQWAPRKRVGREGRMVSMSKSRKRALGARTVLREKSHTLFGAIRASGDVRLFHMRILPSIIAYHLFAGTFIKYVVKGIVKITRKGYATCLDSYNKK